MAAKLSAIRLSEREGKRERKCEKLRREYYNKIVRRYCLFVVF
jgi:hypothetical protein